MEQKKKLILNSILNFNIIIGTVLVLGSVMLLLFLLLPQVIYTIFPSAIDNEITSIQYPVVNDQLLPDDDQDNGQNNGNDQNDLPPVDESLGYDPFIIIDKIGVNSQIYTDTDATQALSKGPWIVPDLGDPIDNALPTIIASHRWGILEWSKEERTQRSFYSLPNLAVGDEIKIIWDRRVFEYEVTKIEESNQITNYNSDLILYTCKVIWQSPIRIFVYANRSN